MWISLWSASSSASTSCFRKRGDPASAVRTVPRVTSRVAPVRKVRDSYSLLAVVYFCALSSALFNLCLQCYTVSRGRDACVANMLIWLRGGKLLEENSVNMIQELVNVFTDMLLVPLIGICKLED